MNQMGCHSSEGWNPVSLAIVPLQANDNGPQPALGRHSKDSELTVAILNIYVLLLKERYAIF